MKRRFLSITIGVALLAGCGSSMKKDEAFTVAVEAMQEESFVAGARAAWDFLDKADENDPRYDRGVRLFAVASESLGLTWAAGIVYRQIAQVRHNLELVPDSLRSIERIVQSGVYDEDALITSFIASEEFSDDMPSDVQGFVNFYQGLDLVRRGDVAWADLRFGKIALDSPYAQRVELVRAVIEVKDGKYLIAIERLEALKSRKDLDPVLRRDVVRTLARIAFEEKRYVDALALYETLRELAPDEPDILLEMAWTYFYQGDSRKTLGLLLALDAPVHRRYITPERYLLEALALRRLCQFGAAREAAVSLERRFAKSLRDLSSGKLPEEIPEIREAGRLRGSSHGNALLVDRMKIEMRILSKNAQGLGPGLTKHLTDLYTRGLGEARIREEILLRKDIASLTEDLLAVQEGVRLIVHELGVSLLRGRRRPAGAEEKPVVDIPITGNRVFYPFRGEYWKDELDDLFVIAEDRCIE